MSDLREEWMKRALNSAKRLVQLIELNAPALIIQNEISMVSDRMRRADPEAWDAAWGQNKD